MMNDARRRCSCTWTAGALLPPSSRGVLWNRGCSRQHLSPRLPRPWIVSSMFRRGPQPALCPPAAIPCIVCPAAMSHAGCPPTPHVSSSSHDACTPRCKHAISCVYCWAPVTGHHAAGGRRRERRPASAASPVQLPTRSDGGASQASNIMLKPTLPSIGVPVLHRGCFSPAAAQVARLQPLVARMILTLHSKSFSAARRLSCDSC
jgi:hypothetical protein